MDFSNASAASKLLLPKIPMLLKTAAFSMLSLSETSSKWDTKTELTVTLIRSLLKGEPEAISKTQKISMRDPGVKGPTIISRVTFAAPAEDDMRQVLFQSIDQLKEGDESYTKPDVIPVEAEWTGFRSDASSDAPEPSISEAEKYALLMKEVKSEATVLYFHGGAYYLMDPASHRSLTSKLAKESGGRVLSVRYRLAPKHPFPSALLDAFQCYLSLLHPPPGSLHTAVPASKIVIAGDSAGGNLSLVLLQLLLQIHRTSSAGATGETPTISFHGRKVDVPLPGGIALLSPWTDLTRSMPSLLKNAKYDYLPPPSQTSSYDFPPCPIWPATPPRANLYCEGNALCHPLVSPLAALNWANAPPVYMSSGEEMLADEAKIVACRMREQGVCVVWDEYEAMPHVFALMLDGNPASKECISQMARFVSDVIVNPEGVECRAEVVSARKLVRERVEWGAGLGGLSDGVVLERMRCAMGEQIAAFEERLKNGSAAAKL